MPKRKSYRKRSQQGGTYLEHPRGPTVADQLSAARIGDPGLHFGWGMRASTRPVQGGAIAVQQYLSPLAYPVPLYLLGQTGSVREGPDFTLGT